MYSLMNTDQDKLFQQVLMDLFLFYCTANAQSDHMTNYLGTDKLENK